MLIWSVRLKNQTSAGVLVAIPTVNWRREEVVPDLPEGDERGAFGGNHFPRPPPSMECMEIMNVDGGLMLTSGCRERGVPLASPSSTGEISGAFYFFVDGLVAPTRHWTSFNRSPLSIP